LGMSGYIWRKRRTIGRSKKNRESDRERLKPSGVP
jgi:hypothetical protein